MKRLLSPLLALTLLATPFLAEAQGRGAGLGGMMQNPITRILSSADSLELGLTAAEVTALTTIQDELTAQNQPHMAALQGLMQGLGGGGAPDPAALQQLQEHMAPMQANNQAAITRVRALLSEDKMVKIDALLAAPGRGGRGAGGGGAGARGGAGGGLGGTPG